MARSGAQQIGATNNFRDPHGSVVDYYSELIGGNVVTAPDEEVAEVVAGHIGLLAEMEIGEGDALTIWDAKTPVHASRSLVLLRF